MKTTKIDFHEYNVTIKKTSILKKKKKTGPGSVLISLAHPNTHTHTHPHTHTHTHFKDHLVKTADLERVEGSALYQTTPLPTSHKAERGSGCKASFESLQSGVWLT